MFIINRLLERKRMLVDIRKEEEEEKARLRRSSAAAARKASLKQRASVVTAIVPVAEPLLKHLRLTSKEAKALSGTWVRIYKPAQRRPLTQLHELFIGELEKRPQFNRVFAPAAFCKATNKAAMSEKVVTKMDHMRLLVSLINDIIAEMQDPAAKIESERPEVIGRRHVWLRAFGFSGEHFELLGDCLLAFSQRQSCVRAYPGAPRAWMKLTAAIVDTMRAAFESECKRIDIKAKYAPVVIPPPPPPPLQAPRAVDERAPTELSISSRSSENVAAEIVDETPHAIRSGGATDERQAAGGRGSASSATSSCLSDARAEASFRYGGPTYFNSQREMDRQVAWLSQRAPPRKLAPPPSPPPPQHSYRDVRSMPATPLYRRRRGPRAYEQQYPRTTLEDVAIVHQQPRRSWECGQGGVYDSDSTGLSWHRKMFYADFEPCTGEKPVSSSSGLVCMCSKWLQAYDCTQRRETYF